MDIKSRPGQALIELAIGLLSLALVLAILFSFAIYIIRALELAKPLRAKAGNTALNSLSAGTAKANDKVKVETLASEYALRDKTLKISEKVYIPPMGVKVK